MNIIYNNSNINIHKNNLYINIKIYCYFQKTC